MKICFKNVGIIIVHGFGKDLNKVSSLAKKLQLLGYKVKTPLLTSNTLIRKDLKKHTIYDWFNDVETSYLELKDSCKDIILIGFSIGGLFTLHLASKYKVKGIIILNTPIYFSDLFRFYKLRKILITLKFLPLKAYINFRRLLKKTKKIIPHINCDIFINQTFKYKNIFHKSMSNLYNKIQSKVKKQMIYKNEKYEDIMIDLVKYIEVYSI